MSQWGSAKARKVLAALLRIGWTIKRESRGSHRILSRPGWPDVVFAFHDAEEIGPRMLARVAKRTGLTPAISDTNTPQDTEVIARATVDALNGLR
jgi:predicted RNA binding protein YcfA (HicA-like mRNA interferase family)